MAVPNYNTKFAQQLMAQAQQQNNGSAMGGLASVLQQALGGYMMGEDQRQSGAANQAMMRGLTEQWSDPSKAVAAVPDALDEDMAMIEGTPGKAAPMQPGNISRAMKLLGAMKDNPHAADMTNQLGMMKFKQDHAAQLAGVKRSQQLGDIKSSRSNAAEIAGTTRRIDAGLLEASQKREERLMKERRFREDSKSRLTRQQQLGDTEEKNRQAILLKQTRAPRAPVPGIDIPYSAEVAEQRADETAGKYKAQGDARADSDQRIRASRPMPPSAVKMQDSIVQKVQISQGLQADMGAVLDLVQNGKMKLSLIRNWESQGRQAIGMSDEASRNYGSFMAKLEKARNDSLRLNSGVQTEGDAKRAWKELMANLNDKDFVEQRLQEIGMINARAERNAKFRVSQIRREFDKPPMDWQATPAPAVIGGTGSEAALDALVEKFRTKDK